MVCRAVGRNRLNQKMDVIQIRADLQKLQLISGRDFQTDTAQDGVHLSTDDSTTIFGWANNMVEQIRDVMTLVNVGTQAQSITATPCPGTAKILRRCLQHLTPKPVNGASPEVSYP